MTCLNSQMEGLVSLKAPYITVKRYFHHVCSSVSRSGWTGPSDQTGEQRSAIIFLSRLANPRLCGEDVAAVAKMAHWDAPSQLWGNTQLKDNKYIFYLKMLIL